MEGTLNVELSRRFGEILLPPKKATKKQVLKTWDELNNGQRQDVTAWVNVANRYMYKTNKLFRDFESKSEQEQQATKNELLQEVENTYNALKMELPKIPSKDLKRESKRCLDWFRVNIKLLKLV